jgi:hypothetical protein
VTSSVFCLGYCLNAGVVKLNHIQSPPLHREYDPTRRTLCNQIDNQGNGWEAYQHGEVVDGNIAMEQIRSNLKSRYSK